MDSLESRYMPTHPEDARKMQVQAHCIERMRDFIGWLFDNPEDEGIHWMSESEAWDLFEKWEEKQYKSKEIIKEGKS